MSGYAGPDDEAAHAAILSENAWAKFQAQRPVGSGSLLPRDCEDCGDPISSKRIEAVPHCTLCVRCGGAAERRAMFAR